MTVYITGITGFVGAFLKSYLQNQGVEVVGVSRKQASPSMISYRQLEDRSNAGQLKGAVIVHCAGRAHVMEEQGEDPEQAYLSVNADLTAKMRDLAIKGGVDHFIFLSTVKVNGERTAAPFSAMDEPMPEDAYGRSKLAAEQHLTAEFCASMAVSIIRLPLVYGPGVKGNLAILENALIKGLPLPLGAVKNQRDMVSVLNLSSFIYHCLQHPQKSSGVWMISDGFSLSTPELCRLMAKGLGVKARLFSAPVFILILVFRLMGKSAWCDRLLGDLQVNIEPALALGWSPIETPNESFMSMYSSQARVL